MYFTKRKKLLQLFLLYYLLPEREKLVHKVSIGQEVKTSVEAMSELSAMCRALVLQQCSPTLTSTPWAAAPVPAESCGSRAVHSRVQPHLSTAQNNHSATKHCSLLAVPSDGCHLCWSEKETIHFFQLKLMLGVCLIQGNECWCL